MGAGSDAAAANPPARRLVAVPDDPAPTPLAQTAGRHSFPAEERER
jgi:hypothetical protein